MEPSLRTRLGASFGSAAGSYADSRPGYPAAAASWLAGSEPADVLDLAAGSGSLTATLVGLGHRVVAAEPSQQMLDRLVSSLPGTPGVASAAESLPFRGGSFDVVTVATAFHWFDAEVALAEIRRVLRPFGRLALVWNTRVGEQGWTQALSTLLRSVRPTGLAGDWGAGSAHALAQSDLFEDVEYTEFSHSQTLDRAGLRGLVASRSYVSALSQEERAEVMALVDQLYADAVRSEPDAAVVLPYVTQCWRATRRP